jgi:hypothetical protein
MCRLLVVVCGVPVGGFANRYWPPGDGDTVQIAVTSVEALAALRTSYVAGFRWRVRA